MNYEHFKTGLLIGLVGLSIILTWQLWTFQP
ncbi:two-component system activity regulator YycH, partial [Halalkalibacter urbisdiaboli]